MFFRHLSVFRDPFTKAKKRIRNILRAPMTDNLKVIGGPENFWLYSETEGYDITHHLTPDAPKVYPRMTLQTQESCVVIDPTKTALAVIDLQNYFLSPALGRPSESLGLQVAKKLKEQALPLAFIPPPFRRIRREDRLHQEVGARRTDTGSSAFTLTVVRVK
ncbi:uncharacterized protein K460DRAFT_415302 [Cucurbitaria berberidis CBS 394.84]|uniref:Isochorismatase-like domain-containing protein n=1 Tax=Cucurbitaria berberidis CBS 394.84 TaxID=1168544 RepID=A0A9P4GLY8_9PLEO|nr:uncharacterized protein K460DRAFT_415302 [Cucurbitaria berberidis CBS 394.84]KAF1848818.1 hypothetical protein K460DRAFT_415302 [Cucurbitaria berberidis CBS 394.84]